MKKIDWEVYLDDLFGTWDLYGTCGEDTICIINERSSDYSKTARWSAYINNMLVYRGKISRNNLKFLVLFIYNYLYNDSKDSKIDKMINDAISTTFII